MSQSCPRCGLVLHVRPGRVVMHHCPRCLGRRRVAVPMVIERDGDGRRPTADPQGLFGEPGAASRFEA